jgi:hypothetical protein
MRRLSALDHMLQNFQHNWETNPQFRAMWSGGLGLAIVVMLCACLGFAFTVSSAIASSYSSGGTSSANPNVAPNGTVKSGSADNTISFPTETVPPWPAPQIPDGPLIPPSTTPQPSPTALPTATPLPTQPAGGGGGGGGGGGCKNCSVTVTSYSMVTGTPFTVTVHTSSPNDTVNVFVKSWPGGASSPQNTGSTDGSGNGTIILSGEPNPCNGTVSLWIVTSLSGSTSTNAQCS